MLMAINFIVYNRIEILMILFENNRLVGIIHFFNNHYVDGDLYIKDYQSTVKHLIPLYGQPQEEMIEWIGEETDALGKAFLEGQVQMGTRWETERSNVSCALMKNDDLFGLAVLISDINSEDFSF